ncbi:hypothetical protein LGH83_07225 [Lichenihabitans sp. PAMC28606]|uniref:hypothetical protein n=1 Tax=Lichenihabitans sp. PAMC28606 TaxID=2880932 RepID=UPI001D0A405C|nr:hypothetical protein [Lichenihabitans sp. PAMC28606]UDL95977.1 hypothetical protein LGH83_07225 [Lichenihabitans sp. PAMC28606]
MTLDGALLAEVYELFGILDQFEGEDLDARAKLYGASDELLMDVMLRANLKMRFPELHEALLKDASFYEADQVGIGRYRVANAIEAIDRQIEALQIDFVRVAAQLHDLETGVSSLNERRRLLGLIKKD